MSTYLEIGPGHGDFLFWLAQENPEATVAAVEYKKKRYDKLVKRVETKNLGNVRLYLGDAREVLPSEFEKESVDKIFILFSDPWPKRRHARHRLFQASFVEELSRVLRPEGLIYVAHDDGNYVRQIRQVFSKFADRFISLDEGVEFSTFYAEKWKKEGRNIQSFSYRKIGCQNEKGSLSLPCVFPTP